jgi:adenosylcobinamide kinase/adenosylcobinamide-phosphate guanylyltransferase
VVLDCVTVWLGNLMHHCGEAQEAFVQVESLLAALRGTPWDWIVVTNEVGLGIVPDNPLARRFRDAAGRLNARLAAAATDVVWMISGIAVPIKTGA